MIYTSGPENSYKNCLIPYLKNEFFSYTVLTFLLCLQEEVGFPSLNAGVSFSL